MTDTTRRYGLGQEYITPYTPEQNGMIERFFLTLKQESVWLQRFENRDHAFRVIADWRDRYDADRIMGEGLTSHAQVGGRTRRAASTDTWLRLASSTNRGHPSTGLLPRSRAK